MINMKMQRRNPRLLVAFFVVLAAIEATFVLAQGNGNGNGNNNGNGNGNGNGNSNNRTAAEEAASTNYTMLSSTAKGQERAFCKARGACYFKTLVCPTECPQRKPKKNRKKKGCFIDCGSKCEVTCKCKPTYQLT